MGKLLLFRKKCSIKEERVCEGNEGGNENGGK